MKIVEPKTYSAKDMYKAFKKQNPKTEIVYWFFKEVLSRYNRQVSNHIIQGETLKLGARLGYSAIKKINRSFSKLRVNWGASNRLKTQLLNEGKEIRSKENPDGEDWFVYYTDDYYFKWCWIKRGRSCSVKNSSVYELVPTANRSGQSKEPINWDLMGNKGKLALANRLNPVLHLRYISD